MSDEERNFIMKVNLDKAKIKTSLPIVAIVWSLITYIYPLILGEFDFGMIFEIISLIFLLIARIYMSKYDVNRAKRYTICSMVTIGWILIYDIIYVISSIQDSFEVVVFGYSYFWTELPLWIYLICLFAINRDLAKADNPIKYKESTDWFYEKYDENEKNEHKEK